MQKRGENNAFWRELDRLSCLITHSKSRAPDLPQSGADDTSRRQKRMLEEKKNMSETGRDAQTVSQILHRAEAGTIDLIRSPSCIGPGEMFNE